MAYILKGLPAMSYMFPLMSSEHAHTMELPDFETLDRIKEAEKKAQEILALAQKKKEALIEQAKKDALLFLQDEEKNALAEREKAILVLKTRLAGQKQRLEKENSQAIEELRKKAGEKSKAEAAFLVKKFLGEVDA